MKIIFIKKIFGDELRGTDSCESSGEQRGDRESFRPVTAVTFGRT